MILNCVVYENGRKLADIPFADVGEYRGRPGCFVWVALADVSVEEIDLAARLLGLDPLAVEDAKRGDLRPRIVEYDDSLFGAMNTVEYDPPDDAEIRVGQLTVIAGARYFLSMRSGARRDFAETRARAEREPELLRLGPGYALYTAMDAVVERYFPVLDALEGELEEIEKEIFVRNAARLNIEALYELKQRLMALKHAVDPLRTATGRLYGGRVPQLSAELQEYFRDVSDQLHTLHDSIDGIQDMIATTIQVNLGIINLNESETMKKLASWAAILAVPTAIAGVYGMNFEHMPELTWAWGYPAALATMAGLDVMLYLWFRRIGWL